MTILAVNQVKQNTTPNIAFEAKDKKKTKNITNPLKLLQILQLQLG